MIALRVFFCGVMCCVFFFKINLIVSFLTLAAFLYSFIRSVEDMRCSDSLLLCVWCLGFFSPRSLRQIFKSSSSSSEWKIYTFAVCSFIFYVSFPIPRFTLLYHLPSILSLSFLCRLCPTEALIFFITRLPSATCTSLAFMFLLCWICSGGDARPFKHELL